MQIYMIYLKYKKGDSHPPETFPLALFETKPSAYHFLMKFNRTFWMLKNRMLNDGSLGPTAIKTLSTVFPEIGEAVYPSFTRFDQLNGFKVLGSAILDKLEVPDPPDLTK